ncbi:MAG: hypothetical protein NC489_45330, partial [Ruminococcus flavefaciens]|nr:hypothetical protein [Ruminococcus flavefaciens]
MKGEKRKFMNIKKQKIKFISALLSFSMIFSNVVPAYAAESVTIEKPVDVESDWVTDEGNFEDVTVTYKQASSFFVTIPKTIVLDGWKQSAYSVKVSGDIGAEQCVYVAPIDVISKTENIDFYMKDQAAANKKEDVVATVTQNKLHWNSAEVAEGYVQDDNSVNADDLTAGAWKGIFQMEIKLESHVTHVHDYVEVITKKPTCTEEGEKTYTCDCGDSYMEKIPATGHSFVEGECEHCGEKDPDYHKHSYTEAITKQPTCTEKGIKTFTCKCGDTYTEEIPAKGHDYGDDDKCTDCGELKPDHEHSYTETIIKAATCTESGSKKKTCICGDEQTETISALGHDYSSTYTTDKVATCTAEGSKSKHCSRCDAKIDVTVIPMTAHSYNSGTVTKAATCTEEGEKTYTCSVCKDAKTEIISALGHDYADTYTVDVEATCTTEGSKSKHCARCDAKTDVTAIPMAKHSYDAGTVTKEATCTEEGEKTYACTVCGNSYTEIIETTEHDWEDHSLIWEPKTITRTTQSGNTWTLSNGSYSRAYANFNMTVNETMQYTFNYTAKIYKSSTDYFLVKLDNTQLFKLTSNATNKSYTITLTPGVHTLYAEWYTADKGTTYTAKLTLNPISHLNHKCTICGNEEDHEYRETITKAATCEEKGEKTFTCVDCGYSYTKEYESLGGHTDEDDDDICDACGHVHIWEENIDIISWTKSSKYSSSSSLVQSGNVWKLHYDASNEYSNYTLNGYLDITVREDTEYTFSYAASSMWGGDSVQIYVDDNLIINFENSNKSGTKTISLSKGSHTIHLCLNKKNTVTT